MKNDTIVIVGHSCSGKTTLANALAEYDYERIVTYTTRKKRPGEKDGVDYHFISKEIFKQRFAKDFFAEVSVYEDGNESYIYGSAKEDYLRFGNKCVILNADGVMSLDVPHRLVFLDIPHPTLKRRNKERDDYGRFSIRYEQDKAKIDLMLEKRKPDIHVKKASNINNLVWRVIR